MRITRRRLLQYAAGAVSIRQPRGVAPAASLDPNSLAKFADPLPIPETIRNSGYRPAPDDPARKIPYYRLAMRQIERKLHRDLPATRSVGLRFQLARSHVRDPRRRRTAGGVGE
jgi:spore coat protein A